MRLAPTLPLLALLSLLAYAGPARSADGPLAPEPTATTPEASGARTAPLRGAMGTKRALLIGIADYAEAAPGQRQRFKDLSGPVNDVRLMETVLRERGFTEITTLTDAEATREGILGAIDAWIASSSEGDDLAFFFAGHGSYAQAAEPDPEEPDGRYETIVPYDAASGARDVLDKELRLRWNRALDRVGASGSLTVMQDNCHSGSGSRGPLDWAQRQADPDLTPVTAPEDVGPPPNTRGALLLSAAQDREPAIEQIVDGQYHGVFTTSLVRALRATPPGAPSRLVFERTLAHVAATGRPQVGVLDGPSTEPLFGEPLAPGGGYGVAVGDVDGETVTLRGGELQGLGVGAELVRFLTTGVAGEPLPDSSVTLIVTATDGPVRSIAAASGEGAVQVGDIFRITRAIPPPGEPLRVWIPPSADASALADKLPCPAGTDCSAAPSAAPEAVALPTGDAWDVTGDAASPTLYRPLPPGAALRSALLPLVETAPGVEVVTDPLGADYWLAGEPTDEGVRYGWVQRGLAQTGEAPSPLPLYSTRLEGDATGARILARDAGLMARVKSWLTIQSPDPSPFPVEILGLVRESDGVVLRPNAAGVLTLPPSPGLCSANEELCYRLALGVTPEALSDYRGADVLSRRNVRYAYAFVIGPEGDSCLYYPFNRCNSASANADNKLALSDRQRLTARATASGDSVYTFDLGNVSPRFSFTSEPFGRQTVVLLTTNEPVPEPGKAFNWPAIGEGNRKGDFEDGPASWSVHRLSIDVIPGASAPGTPGSD